MLKNLQVRKIPSLKGQKECWLNNIEEILQNVCEITVGKHVNKGKNTIQNFDEGASSNPTVVNHNIGYADSQGLEHNLGNQEYPTYED